MKKSVSIILALFLFFSLSSISYADQYTMMGREISPGYPTPDGVEGALFVGNFFDDDGISRGYFILTLGHDGMGVEECSNPDDGSGITELQSFKLVMKFNYGGRLVLAIPTDAFPVFAVWDSDDPNCPDGNCPLIGYDDFLDPIAPPTVACNADGSSELCIGVNPL
jgi:hypothetical protein